MPSKRLLTPEGAIAMLKQRQGCMTNNEYADRMGISAQFLSNVFAGRRTPSEKILDYLGLEDAGQAYRMKGKN